MCGACDVSCKYSQDIEVLQPLYELRSQVVGDGQLNPVHMMTIEGLRKEDNMMLESKADRGNWAEGLTVKNVTRDGGEVYFHTGCRYSYDSELWPVAQAAVRLLQTAGVDVAIAGKDENCCGGRAYDLGYLSELTKYAENNVEMLAAAKVKTVVTCCSDCYHAFKVLYDKLGLKKDVQVFHITEYLERLIAEGRLQLRNEVPLTVTYHDPCHLGRLGEPWVHWEGIISTKPSERWRHIPEKTDPQRARTASTSRRGTCSEHSRAEARGDDQDQGIHVVLRRRRWGHRRLSRVQRMDGARSASRRPRTRAPTRSSRPVRGASATSETPSKPAETPLPVYDVVELFVAQAVEG